jgi:hypothetical protein
MLISGCLCGPNKAGASLQMVRKHSAAPSALQATIPMCLGMLNCSLSHSGRAGLQARVRDRHVTWLSPLRSATSAAEADFFVACGGGPEGPLYPNYLELFQHLTFLLFRQKRRSEGVLRQLAQLSLAETEDLLRDLVFVRQCCMKHIRIVGIQGHQHAGIE